MYENVSALAASCCIFPRQYHTLSHEMHQTHEIKVEQVVFQHSFSWFNLFFRLNKYYNYLIEKKKQFIKVPNLIKVYFFI